jgi:hypothetical protein
MQALSLSSYLPAGDRDRAALADHIADGRHLTP